MQRDWCRACIFPSCKENEPSKGTANFSSGKKRLRGGLVRSRSFKNSLCDLGRAEDDARDSPKSVSDVFRFGLDFDCYSPWLLMWTSEKGLVPLARLLLNERGGWERFAWIIMNIPCLIAIIILQLPIYQDYFHTFRLWWWRCTQDTINSSKKGWRWRVNRNAICQMHENDVMSQFAWD